MEFKKVAVIDLDSVCFTIGHGNKILDNRGNPMRSEDGRRFLYEPKTEDELKDAADTVISGLLQRGGFDAYIAYIKGSNTTKQRLSLDPGYKGTRPKESPDWWAFVKKDLIERWNAIVVDNMEVDDAVNITRLKVKNSHIVAIDKDLLLLEGTSYNWRADSWSCISEEDAAYYFWKSAITGKKALPVAI